MLTTTPAADFRTAWWKVRMWLVNGTIVLLLALMLQGMPLTMNATNNAARYFADWLGIGHAGWSMYAPEPDRQNHRLAAEIMSDDDHVIAHWESPRWPQLSAAQRFRQHRWTEYYDNVWTDGYSQHWPALVQHIVRTTKVPRDEDPPRRVRLLIEKTDLPPPQGSRWPKPSPPEKYNDRWVLQNEPLQ